jgi:hypothetical protein
MSVRELVFAMVADDPYLGTLGLNTATVYANGAPDSPQERFFAVIRWGPETPGVPGQRGAGRVTERSCSLWVYDKQPDYANINLALKRWVVLLDTLEPVRTGTATGDGWVTEAYWESDGDDGYDDVYEAYYRSSTYTIVASGN